MDFMQDTTLFLRASEGVNGAFIEIWKVDFDAVPLEPDSFYKVGEATNGSYFTNRNKVPLSHGNFDRLVYFLRSLQCFVNCTGALIVYVPPIDPAVSDGQYIRCLDMFDWGSFGITPGAKSYRAPKFITSGVDVEGVLPPHLLTKSNGERQSSETRLFDTTFDQLESKNLVLQANLNKVQTDLADCESRVKLAELTSSMVQADLEKVKEDLTSWESRARLAEATLDELKSENLLLQADLDNAKEEITDWECKAKLAETTLDGLKSENSILQADLEKVNADLTDWQGKAKKAEETANRLKPIPGPGPGGYYKGYYDPNFRG